MGLLTPKNTHDELETEIRANLSTIAEGLGHAATRNLVAETEDLVRELRDEANAAREERDEARVERDKAHAALRAVWAALPDEALDVFEYEHRDALTAAYRAVGTDYRLALFS